MLHLSWLHIPPNCQDLGDFESAKSSLDKLANPGITSLSSVMAHVTPKPTPDLPDSVFAMFSLKGFVSSVESFKPIDRSPAADQPPPQTLEISRSGPVNLDRKVAAITGGGTGIGYQVARAYAEAGADVALFYNSTNTAIELAAGLEKEFGVKSKAYKVPVTDSEIVTKSINQVATDFGRLDIFVANAGMKGGGIVTDMDDERWKLINDVNYNSVFYCARAVGRIFKEQGSGNLIVTSSMSAHIVNRPRSQAVYNATKAAISHLAKSLAYEWRDFARVNVVSPGFFDTGMGAVPEVLRVAYDFAVLGRVGHPKEIKGIYLYLASDASTFTTGSDFIIDGGYTLP